MCVFLALSRILDGTGVENPGTEAKDDLDALDMKALPNPPADPPPENYGERPYA